MVDETLKCIGAKLGVSAAEIALAWLLEQDSVVAMPKAQRIESQRANLAALNLNRDGARSSRSILVAQAPLTEEHHVEMFTPRRLRRIINATTWRSNSRLHVSSLARWFRSMLDFEPLKQRSNLGSHGCNQSRRPWLNLPHCRTKDRSQGDF